MIQSQQVASAPLTRDQKGMQDITASFFFPAETVVRFLLIPDRNEVR
jgi:hypothetical protein